MGGALLALGAGALTVLSPCVLPILPIVLGGAAARLRHGPAALAAGMVLGFTGVGLTAASALSAVSAAAVQSVAAALLVLFGVILLAPLLRERFTSAAAPAFQALSGVASRFPAQGLGGQFALGALLGAAWTPCAGPTLGAAISLSAQAPSLPGAALVMAMFAAGASLPLLALAYGSRHALAAKRRVLERCATLGPRIMGAALVAVGALMLLGLDRALEAYLLERLPDWLLDLTTTL